MQISKKTHTRMVVYKKTSAADHNCFHNGSLLLSWFQQTRPDTVRKCFLNIFPVITIHPHPHSHYMIIVTLLYDKYSPP